MSTVKLTVPNWCQRLIASAVGLDPEAIVVRVDSDDTIVMMDHKTRNEYIINKATGKVVEA